MRFAPLVIIITVFANLSASAHPLADWLRAGETATIERALADGRWKGTVAGDLAQAVLGDAARAVPVYRRAVASGDLPQDLQALAWHRLYSYALMAGDLDLKVDAARWLTDHPVDAAPWFPGGLPDPPPGRLWTVQIGAFSSQGNARRLADEQRAKGYTVQIDSLPRATTTLYAVRVGRFDDESSAQAFAARVYGASGTTYRLVETAL